MNTKYFIYVGMRYYIGALGYVFFADTFFLLFNTVYTWYCIAFIQYIPDIVYKIWKIINQFKINIVSKNY